MIKVKEAIIVEGRYDKIKLSSLIDGLIIETHGFQIFSDREQMKFIRKMADERGLLILTDSDSAGFLIRNYLSGSISPEKIRHAYIPDIYGKERRKEHASKEGKLGVEGVPSTVLLDALKKAGIACCKEEPTETKPLLTKADLFIAGLSGGQESAKKRKAFLKSLHLPEYLSSNALLKVLNGMLSPEDFWERVKKI